MRARDLLLGFAALGAVAAGPAPEGPPLSGTFAKRYRVIEEPTAAPAYAFQDAEGREKALVEYGGRVVIATFWATWCGVCARELPKLDRLQARLGGEGLSVVALSQDAGLERIRAWYAKRGIEHLEVNRDEGAVLGSILGIRGVPTSFVVDKRGRMVGVVQGAAAWESPEATALLRHYLD